MSAFFRQINHNPLGDRLRERRLDRGINLKRASRDLGIAVKYLEALENWRAKEFLNINHLNRLLDVYVKYLEISNKEVERLRQEINVSVKERVFSFSLYNFLIKSFFIFIFLVIVSFLIYNFSAIFFPPRLKIITPLDGTVTYQRQLRVSGVSEVEAEITINNKAVLLEQDGSFDADIDLQSGLNLITIIARKKYGRANEVELRVLFRD